MRLLVAIMVAALATQATAQDVKYASIVVPPQVEEYRIVPVEVTSGQMPAGFKVIDVLWDVSDKLDVWTLSDQKMLFTGPPGTYVLQFDAVVVQEKTFKDGDGNEVTINDYKFRIKEKATVTIGAVGPQPPPGPDPPDPPDPKPSGKYNVMMFYHQDEKNAMPLPQLAILTSMTMKDAIEAAGHTLVERLDVSDVGSVPAAYKPFFDAAAGKKTPCVVIIDKETGAAFYRELPADVNAMLDWLKDPTQSSNVTWRSVIQEVEKLEAELRSAA